MDIEKCIKDDKRDIFSQVRTNLLRAITNGINDMPRDTYDALFRILVSCSVGTLYNKLIRLQSVHEPEAYLEVVKPKIESCVLAESTMLLQLLAIINYLCQNIIMKSINLQNE